MAADKLDISRMDGRIVDEIMEYMEDNNVEAPTTVYEGLDMFLRWNGIIGYTSLILRAVQELQDAAKPAPILPVPSADNDPEMGVCDACGEEYCIEDGEHTGENNYCCCDCAKNDGWHLDDFNDWVR